MRHLFSKFPLLVLMCFSLIGFSANAGVLPYTPSVDRLNNGLTVVVVPFDSPGIIAYYTVVRVGSRNEVEPGHSGFAHFFEHMMFRGTPTYPASKYNAVLQKYGADNNAFTTDDFTCYTLLGPKEALSSLVTIEADRFANLSYSLEDFQTESKAVLGEYAKNAASPGSKLFETLRATAFSTHTYQHTTLGFLEDIQAMPGYYEYSQKFFDRYYTPDNTTVIIVGDVTRDEILPLIEKEYSAWTKKKNIPDIAKEPEQNEARQKSVPWNSPAQDQMLLGYKTPGFAENLQETAALHVLHEMLFGRASELYQKLVLEEKTLEDLSPYTGWHHKDPHLLIIDATLKEGASYEKVQQAFDQSLSALMSGKIDQNAIEATKKHLRYETLMGFDTTAGVAVALARYVAMTGDIKSLDAYLQAIQSVTSEEILEVAKKYLRPEKRTIVTLETKGGAI